MLKKTSNLQQMMVYDGMGLLLNYENLIEGSDGDLLVVFLEQNKILKGGSLRFKNKMIICFD